MENTYHLIVEQRAGGRHLRTLDELAPADRLIADYEAGEIPGGWVGALVLPFGDTDRLIAALPLAGTAVDVQAELASRLEWCERQTALDRWSPLSPSMETQP